MLYGYDFMLDIGKKSRSEKIIWGVLVGAFSDFRHADTDNPVQISMVFGVSEVFLESKGLI